MRKNCTWWQLLKLLDFAGRGTYIGMENIGLHVYYMVNILARLGWLQDIEEDNQRKKSRKKSRSKPRFNSYKGKYISITKNIRSAKTACIYTSPLLKAYFVILRTTAPVKMNVNQSINKDCRQIPNCHQSQVILRNSSYQIVEQNQVL